jgi:hypothetical protein
MRATPSRVIVKLNAASASDRCHRLLDVAAGALHTVFVSMVGDVLTCGGNGRRQLGNPEPACVTVAKPIHWAAAASAHSRDHVVACAAGASHTLLLFSKVMVSLNVTPACIVTTVYQK